jgi:hypothetical protein
MRALFLCTLNLGKFLNLMMIIVPLISCLLLPATAKTSTETIVKVSPSSISVVVDEIFVVNITVIDVYNLYGVEATVSWNTSFLQLVDVDIRLGVQSHPDGVLHEPFLNITQQDTGKFTIGATSYTPAPSFNGSGNIVRITFKVINIGESIIGLETKLYDYPPLDREPRESLPIQHTTMDGTLNAVIPEIPNMIGLIIFLVIATIVLVFFIKTQKTNNSSRQKFNTVDIINIINIKKVIIVLVSEIL